MTSSSFMGLLVLLPAALLSFSCGDGGGDGGSGGASSAGSGSNTAGTSSGAANGGSGGSAGTAHGGGTGGSTAGGSAGGGEVVWAYYGFCSPICTGGYCALTELAGASGQQPPQFQAECRPFRSCTGTEDQASCPLPARCVDDPSDDCQGANCPGLCSCMARACMDGMAFDERPEVCKCVPAKTPIVDCADIECPTGLSCGEVFGTAACVKKLTR